MPDNTPQYISVSRRTDIPRFYADYFFAAWRRGEIVYDGGYGRMYTVSLRSEDVLGYIFWSKDYSVFIRQHGFDGLLQENNAVFHYTLNHCRDLEPGLPPLKDRLATLNILAEKVGPQCIVWRYDPLCRYQLRGGRVRDNIAPFYTLLPLMAATGIKRCYFSFMTSYNKVKKRASSVRFLTFDAEEKLAIAATMGQAAKAVGITLFNCCNREVFQTVDSVRQASCIDDRLLNQTDRFGVHRTLTRGATRKDCGCYKSRDVGSYSQKCGHGCFYCYANPVTASL